MRKIRSCTNAQLNTGISKCPPEFGKMKGAILVEPGTKLPEDLTGDKLEELCHADPIGFTGSSLLPSMPRMAAKYRLLPMVMAVKK